MLRYQLPTDLTKRIPHVRAEYNKCYPQIEKQNPVRKQQIKIFEVLTSALQDPQIKALIKLNERPTVEAGMWCLIMAAIGREHKDPNPFFSPGRIYNSGSKLFTIMHEQMGIDEKNSLTQQQRIVYLEHLYNLLIDNPKANERLTELLREQDLNLPTIHEMMLQAFSFTMSYLSNDVEKLEQAPPTTAALEQQMSHLHKDYVDAKKKQSYLSRFFTCKDREMYAQFAEVLCVIVAKRDFPKSKDSHEFDRKTRIEYGILFFISQLLSNECILFNPSGVLNKRLMSILHRDKIGDFDNPMKLDAISTLKNFLIDTTVVEQIEAIAAERFEKNLLTKIDTKMYRFHTEINGIIFYLMNNLGVNLPITNHVMKLGGTVGEPIGYGSGAAAGVYASRTTGMVPVQNKLSKGISIATKAVGLSQNYLSFWVAGFLLENILSRAIATMLQKLGKGIGMIIFGTGGLVADGAYLAFKKLCLGWLHSYDPAITNEAEVDFVRSLYRLPEKVYTQDRKEKIKTLFVEDFFAIPNEQHDENNKVIKCLPYSRP